MPYPRRGEKKSDYISRCVKRVLAEGLTRDHALGKCYGMWRTYHGAKKAVGKHKPLEVK